MSSTWEDFTSLLPAVDAALPIVTKEIGDTWCEGTYLFVGLLLFVVVCCCLLFVVVVCCCCLLFVVCYLLFVVCYLLFESIVVYCCLLLSIVVIVVTPFSRFYQDLRRSV